MSKTLLEISDEMAALESLLEEVGGDVTDESASKYVDQLFAEIGEALHSKVDGYATLIRKCDLTAAARREEAERILAGSRAEENKAKWLKERLKFVLTRMNIKKAGHIRTASICANGGKAPLNITAARPEEVPPQYQKTVVAFDEVAIRAALEAGVELPFASLLPRGSHVRIS